MDERRGGARRPARRAGAGGKITSAGASAGCAGNALSKRVGREEAIQAMSKGLSKVY